MISPKSVDSPKILRQALLLPNGAEYVCLRPMWNTGWEAVVRITFDADKFSRTDVGNLLQRAGMQVGIGEGRQSSRMCVGVGWGAFAIKGN